MVTKRGAFMTKGAIHGGATEVWGAVAPNCPTLDPPLITFNTKSGNDRCESMEFTCRANT